MNNLLKASPLILALLLCGCNPLMRASYDTFRASMGGPQSLNLTQAQVDAVPYPQIQVTTSTSEGVMALVRQRGDLQFWVASGKQVLLIRDGLVVRSVGLGLNLDGTYWDGESPFKHGLQRLENNYTSTRHIDLYEGDSVGITLRSRFYLQGVETVEVLKRPYSLLRVDEHIEAQEISFNAVNRYWVRPTDGFIVQSEQHLTPSLTLKITQLQPQQEVTP